MEFVVILANLEKHFIRVCDDLSQYPRIIYSLIYYTEGNNQSGRGQLVRERTVSQGDGSQSGRKTLTEMYLTIIEKQSKTIFIPLLIRIWLSIVAEENEYVYGGGEQYTYLNLRGRNYPIWVREQGVGRNKSSTLTQLMDAFSKGTLPIFCKKKLRKQNYK